jgi:multiple sugar transport system substrate-binding protein
VPEDGKRVQDSPQRRRPAGAGTPRKGQAMKSIFRAVTLAAVAAAVLLVVGAGTVATAGSQAKVTITVAALRPGSSADAQRQFNDNVTLFERQHPNIVVKPVDYAWDGATFAAQLAAGTLPTVFTVPFTDARTLGEHHQVADITAYVKKWSYYKKFQKTIIAEATTANGRIIGVPYAAYAQALHYNRQLFRQAGLDPNKPPTTWAQLRKDAKQIAKRTGQAGYAEMGLNDNTAGWILTTVTYTFGGRMETGRGTSARATLNNKYTVQALKMLHQMRWVDNSMGSTFDYTWPTINQAFSAGKVGMFINGSDIYTFLVQATSLDPKIYGVAPLPVANNKSAGVLGGGSIAVVRPNTNGAKLAAAMKWIDFFYMQKLVNKGAALRDTRILVANKQPVGVPAFPIFNKKQYDLANSWIKPFINVPIGQMSPFLKGIFKQRLYPEPAAATQSVYHALDPVVQAVFTDKNANINGLLSQANQVAQSAISSGK